MSLIHKHPQGRVEMTKVVPPSLSIQSKQE